MSSPIKGIQHRTIDIIFIKLQLETFLWKSKKKMIKIYLNILERNKLLESYFLINRAEKKAFRVLHSRSDSLLSGSDVEIIDITNKAGDKS